MIYFRSALVAGICWDRMRWTSFLSLFGLESQRDKDVPVENIPSISAWLLSLQIEGMGTSQVGRQLPARARGGRRGGSGGWAQGRGGAPARSFNGRRWAATPAPCVPCVSGKRRKCMTRDWRMGATCHVDDFTFDVSKPNTKLIYSVPYQPNEKIEPSRPKNQRCDHTTPLWLPTKRYPWFVRSWMY